MLLILNLWIVEKLFSARMIWSYFGRQTFSFFHCFFYSIHTYLYWISQVLLNIWDIWLITKNSPLFCNRLNHFSGTWKKQTTLRHFWKSLRASFFLLNWFNIKPSQPCRCYVMCTFETFLRNKVDSIFWCTIVAKDF